MQTTDDDLKTILDCLPKRKKPSQAINGFFSASEVVQEHSELIEKVFHCLNEHPEFSFSGTLFFDTAQLHLQPYSGAISLTSYAHRCGSQEAINWYRCLIGTKNAYIRHAGLISGLSTNAQVDFSNGISIIPFDQAGDSPQVLNFQSLAIAHPLQNIFGSYYYTIAFRDIKHDKTAKIPVEPVSHEVVTGIEEVLIGCVLNEGLAPALSFSWKEFLDPELRAAEVSWGASGSPQDAPVNFGRLLKQEDIPNIELFLNMSGAFKKKLRLALTRVSLARRKSTSANKAIEYCIALEALLSDGKHEMTHKIATRAAVILGNGVEERVKYRKLFKGLYNARSNAVHGDDVSQSGCYEIVRKCEKAISKLLLVAANRGKEFDFDKLDLKGEM